MPPSFSTSSANSARLSVIGGAWVAAGALAALLVTAVVALILATQSFDRAAVRTERGAAVQDAVDDSLRAVIDMETGVRAFLLTGERAVLDPWTRGRRAFGVRSVELERLMADDDHAPVTRRFRAAGLAYASGYGEPLLGLRAAGPLPERQVRGVVAAGKRMVDRMRAMLGRLEATEHREDVVSIDAAQDAAARDRGIGLAALGAAALVVVLVGALLRHGLLLPLRRLRRAAERLSRGDLSATVDGATSREVAPVGRALAGIAERGKELTADLEEARLEVLQRLARATEYRDDDTHEHTERVGRMAALLATRLGLDAEAVETLRLAAPLHDVGKVGIPDAILLKPGRLTEDEYREMQRHTTFGAEMLMGSPSPVLQLAERIALGHHERWDGGGYPLGLVGDETPLPARIVAVADVFDALTHERPYKDAWPVERAREEIAAQAGAQFDPHVVQAFLDLTPGQLAAVADATRSGARQTAPSTAFA